MNCIHNSIKYLFSLFYTKMYSKAIFLSHEKVKILQFPYCTWFFLQINLFVCFVTFFPFWHQWLVKGLWKDYLISWRSQWLQGKNLTHFYRSTVCWEEPYHVFSKIKHQVDYICMECGVVSWYNTCRLDISYLLVCDEGTSKYKWFIRSKHTYTPRFFVPMEKWTRYSYSW